MLLDGCYVGKPKVGRVNKQGCRFDWFVLGSRSKGSCGVPIKKLFTSVFSQKRKVSYKIVVIVGG